MSAPQPERGGPRRWLALAACMLCACAPLSPRTSAPAHHARPADAGALAEHGERVEARLAEQESAYWLLDDNAEALRVRIALVDLAERTLDIQYFIWQDDMTGRLLMQHVLAAADRGVRVRFFVDDLGMVGRNDELAGLAAHPSVDVRLFNPWKVRFPPIRPFEFVFRIGVLNHRMHNKLLIADGRFGIVGGRNIGDRYFGVYEEFVQNDIDLMVAGPLLEDMARSFDTFWNSEHAHPVRADGPEADARLAALRRRCAASVAANETMLSAFGAPVEGWQDYFGAVMQSAMHGPGELYVDSPDVRADASSGLYEQFKSLLSRARRELILSSPYLVPDEEFVALLERLVQRGVRVRVLTNSLASNSHVVAHSAYKDRRRELLETGVELYEMRADAEVLGRYRTPPADPNWLALHTKAAVVDGRWSFVGSPNIDPRSMVLNTEIGVVADDPELAGELTRLLNRDMRPENSWRVTLEPGGWLKWWNGDDALGRQPAKGFQQRAVEFFLNLIPIKNQA
ncbi:MAG TPA: phospholipase D family protein [Gammaproteobacteria bacterium]